MQNAHLNPDAALRVLAEIQERLHPRTLADLAFRPLAFASIAAGLAERDRKKKPKPKR